MGLKLIISGQFSPSPNLEILSKRFRVDQLLGILNFLKLVSTKQSLVFK